MKREKTKSDRVRVMEEAVEGRNKVLEKEGVVLPRQVELEADPKEEKQEELKEGLEVKPEPVEESVKEPVQVKDNKAEPEIALEPETKEPPKPEMVTVKVDGEESLVPKEEVDKAGSLALYQIEKAMQKRLKEINEKSGQLSAVLAQLNQQAQPKPGNGEDEGLRQKITALRFGSDEEAIGAAKELLKPANIPVDQLTDTVTKRFEWDQAVKTFIKDNAELLKDPDIQTIAIARENVLKQTIQSQGKWPQDISKFYNDLGAELKSKYGKPATIDLKSRQEKKEQLTEPKTASGKIPPKPEEKVKTAADAIAEQRKARGQHPEA